MRRSAGNTKAFRDRKGISSLPKRPSVNTSNDSVSKTFEYTVLYYKRKNKVHKSKGVSKLDGRLTFQSQEAPTKPSTVTLLSEDGAIIYQGGMRGTTGQFHIDETISVGAYDVEILSLDNDNVQTAHHFETPQVAVRGNPLLQNRQRLGINTGLGGGGNKVRKAGLGGKRPLGGLGRKPAVQPLPSVAGSKKQKTSLVDSENSETGINTRSPKPSMSVVKSPPISAPRNYTKTVLPGFKRPMSRPISSFKTPSLGLSRTASRPKVLPSNSCKSTGTANTETQTFFPGAVGNPVVPHSIRKVLRPHQIEGVVFLWNCLTGNGQAGNISPHYHDENDWDDNEELDNDRKRVNSSTDSTLPSPKGCILSDEMGLGKTLMTIATISALHRQNRTNRFIVVCPASLVNNWAGEFDKWLGKVGLPKRVVIKKGGEEGIRQFKTFCAIKPSNISEVLIVSYDLFRMKSAILKNVQKVALLVVDEGHRLKNTKGSHTMTALEALPCEARLCITATPIQNNLGDMYTIVNFVCPGVLGDITTFRREYERPITAITNKRKSCTSDQIRKGEQSRLMLDKILQSLMLRRLQKDVLKKLLPPRHVFLLFCRPTLQQRNLYQKISKCHANAGDGESSQEVLTALMKLRKICTHPKLLEPSQCQNVKSLESLGALDCEGSGKLVVLRDLILQMREKEPTDKIVIISNFTSTLTVIEEAILKKLNLNFLRLDGSINSADRQSLVDTFNRTSASANFALTLSSKAGGVGLNLIGANRLIMVDPDWNPSTDIQAMARIYREGQKKSCFIYRCFTSGTLEEIILQRQIQKGSLATMTMDRAQKSRKASEGLNADEIRDCFTLKHESCACDTRQKVRNWPDYDGRASLISQGCQDTLLMDVAGTQDANNSMLSFVHIVNDDDKKANKPRQQEIYDSGSEFESDEANDRIINEPNDDLQSESSDEEFEFE